jgi:methionyl-tRNA formyltransferase
MKITILCSSINHPIYKSLVEWVEKKSVENDIKLISHKEELDGGDILFLVSCTEIIEKKYREKYVKTLVIHASDLPSGRGWSPLVWQVLEGKKDLVMTLLEAEDSVDSGDIWKKTHFNIPKDALFDEINTILFNEELGLMDFAVTNFRSIVPTPQPAAGEVTYYGRRSPEDSQIDANKSIAEQFDLLRVCDPLRYPAFFDMHGCRYKLTLEKIHNDKNKQ